MDNTESVEDRKSKVSAAGSSLDNQSRYPKLTVSPSRKLNESQTKPLSSRGKKQRQKSKLAPRG